MMDTMAEGSRHCKTPRETGKEKELAHLQQAFQCSLGDKVFPF